MAVCAEYLTRASIQNRLHALMSYPTSERMRRLSAGGSARASRRRGALARSPRQRPLANAQEAKMDLLLVEDNVADTRLIRHMVQSFPAPAPQLKEVDRLESALRELEQHPFDAVLLDLGLPDSEGLETLQRAKAAGGHPIIILTGLNDEHSATAAVRAGAQDYLIKDQLNEQTLARSIRYAIERHRDRAALRSSEERFRRLAENAPDIIFRYRLAQQRGFEYVSPAAEKITGHSVAAHYARPDLWLEISAPDAQARLKSLLRGDAWSRTPTECRWTRPDRSVAIVEIESVLVHADDGALLAIEGIARDVTERERLTLQFRHAQKMESIGRLAGGVAHDFNNLLTVITGSASVAREQTAGGSSLAGHLDRILHAASSSAELTRKLLTFARRQAIDLRVLDLNAQVAGLDGLLRRLIGDDVVLTTIPAREPTFVRADPGQIEQVVMNLAVNSRDAMPEGGNLTVEVTVLSPQEAGTEPLEALPAEWVALSVSDTGVGMSDDVKARLFEPFFTTKSPDKGSGLGLATCYGIVKQVGGHIQVFSEPGAGATFRVLLPRVSEGDDAAEPLSRAALAARGEETILLVAENAAVRGKTAGALQQQGYTVLDCATTDQAMQHARSRPTPIHLAIIVTPTTPPSAAQDLARRVRSLLRSTKVLMIAEQEEEAPPTSPPEQRPHATLTGAHSLSTLVLKVRELLDGPPAGA